MGEFRDEGHRRERLVARLDFLIGRAEEVRSILPVIQSNALEDLQRFKDFVSDVLAIEENPDWKQDIRLLDEVVLKLEKQYQELSEKYK